MNGDDFVGTGNDAGQGVAVDDDRGLEELAEAAMQLVASMDEHAVDLGVEEILAVDPQANVRLLAPGILLVDAGVSFATFAAAFAAAPPIFIRHVFPVTATLSLAAPNQGVSDPLQMLEMLLITELLAYVHPKAPFSIQTRIVDVVVDAPAEAEPALRNEAQRADPRHGGRRELKPYAVNQRLANCLLESGGPALDVRKPEQIISVLIVPAEDGAPFAYVGASWARDNLSDWAGGMRRFAREPEQISRAEFKLLEAIEVFGLDLPPRGRALDLGAAPGGWTRVLRNLEQYVTAVDPGDLDERLAEDRGVRHKRMTAERYLAEPPDRHDILVNDMRMDARDSARLMVRYAPYLYPHGWALMTLKLPMHHRRALLKQAFEILQEAFTAAGARQLFHNRSEITVYLRPK